MKVDAPSGQPVSPTEHPAPSALGKETSDEIRHADSRERYRDDVDVSEEAERLRRIYAELDALPDVRAARVEELRRAVEAGTYEVQVDTLTNLLTHLLG